jgi:outer membrane protein assembly factor BamD
MSSALTTERHSLSEQSASACETRGYKQVNFIVVLMAIFFSLAVCSCASGPEEEPAQENVEDLYNRAHKLLDKGSFTKSAQTFEKVELEYPYSKWATKAQIMGAYAYYKNQKYDDAVLALDRFIKFHPGNADISYAYYMKALCYYEQINSVDRDQSNTEKALDALYQVIARFPDTDYAKDASVKLDLTNDHLAGKEMEVGRYYLSQKNYLSALNRFSTVVNEYQTTTHIEEALYRQVELYQIIGLSDEASNAYKVLNHNYPNSKWTTRAKSLVAA